MTSSDPVDFAQYTIVPALTELQQVKHWRAAHLPWGRGRTWEEYHAASKRDAELLTAAGHAFVTWLLVRRDDTEGPIYSACETHRRQAFMRRQKSAVVEHVTTYGVAAVVTPPEQQRKGYATHMLRLLHYVIAVRAYLPPFPPAWGAPPTIPESIAQNLPRAWASVLWSDMGSKFYPRCTIGLDRPGWTGAAYSTELKWTLKRDDGLSTSPWRVLYPSDLPRITQHLTAKRKQNLALMEEGKASMMAIDPANPGTLAYIHDLRHLAPSQRATTPIGGLLTDVDGRDTIVLFGAHVYLHYKFGDRTKFQLFITDVQDLLPHQLESLIMLLDSIGMQFGKSEGCIWGLNPDGDLAREWLTLSDHNPRLDQRPERFGNILQMVWYGPEQEQGQLMDGGMWAWC